jgi:hypothetical protein
MPNRQARTTARLTFTLASTFIVIHGIAGALGLCDITTIPLGVVFTIDGIAALFILTTLTATYVYPDLPGDEPEDTPDPVDTWARGTVYGTPANDPNETSVIDPGTTTCRRPTGNTE